MTDDKLPSSPSPQVEEGHSTIYEPPSEGRAFSSVTTDQLLHGYRYWEPVPLSAGNVLFGEAPKAPIPFDVEVVSVPGLTYSEDTLDCLADAVGKYDDEVTDPVIWLDTETGCIGAILNVDALDAGTAMNAAIDWFCRVLNEAGIAPAGAIGQIERVEPSQ